MSQNVYGSCLPLQTMRCHRPDGNIHHATRTSSIGVVVVRVRAFRPCSVSGLAMDCPTEEGMKGKVDAESRSFFSDITVLLDLLDGYDIIIWAWVSSEINSSSKSDFNHETSIFMACYVFLPVRRKSCLSILFLSSGWGGRLCVAAVPFKRKTRLSLGMGIFTSLPVNLPVKLIYRFTQDVSILY